MATVETSRVAAEFTFCIVEVADNVLQTMSTIPTMACSVLYVIGIHGSVSWRLDNHMSVLAGLAEGWRRRHLLSAS